jgi:arylsulfatase
MHYRLAVVVLLALAGLDAAHAAAESGRPNILLIVADDLGYADLGVYGSEIDTPNIDSLARTGVLFTQFHTAPMCAPTRAMLLSGNNNAVAGVASQNRTGIGGVAVPGYEGSLSDRVAPLPRVLRDAGYNTYMTGKWHLGAADDKSPFAAGFERTFSLIEGGGTHFDNQGFEEGGSHYRENGKIARYPDGRFSTDFYTDKIIEFIEADKANGQPFFVYAAYTAPHWPLQVPDDYLDLYRGNYDDGYDSLRERRFESLKEAGIIPLDAALPPRNDVITPWEELPEAQQKIESRMMEVYAAMIDNLDDHIGRLMAYLDENGLLDNTLVVFMGDNGAAAEDFYNGYPYDGPTAYIRARFDNSLENIGTRASFAAYGAQWAEAGSAPYRWRKSFLHEGGIVAPMIVSGAGVERSGEIDSGYATVMDIAPTLIEVAGARYPDSDMIRPMVGESMAGFLGGQSDRIHDDSYVTVLAHRGQAMARRGRWKIVTTFAPFDESKFQLYDLQSDPGETVDLRSEEPEIFAELLGIWRKKRIEYGYILPQDL